VNFRDWLASGGAAPRLLLCIGVILAALAARAIFGEPRRAPRNRPVPAPAATTQDAPPAAPRPQVRLLGGPKTREASRDEPAMGDVRSGAYIEGERRRVQLGEVLSRLDGSPVWVEGIDGPSPQPDGRAK